MPNQGESVLKKELFPQNEGSFDRMLRVLVGFFMIFFAAVWMSSGVLEYIFYVLGFVLTFTGITGYCKLYDVFHIDTTKSKHHKQETLALLLFFYVILVPLLIVMVKNYVDYR